MTDMEQDILERACTHYIKKRNPLGGMPKIENDLWQKRFMKILIEDFWRDYFSGNPIYNQVEIFMNREPYWDYMGRKMRESRTMSKDDLWKQEIVEMQKTVYWCYNRIRELNEEIYEMQSRLDSYQRAKKDLRQMELEL